MPHFIIDCTENVLAQKASIETLQAIHDIAEASGLFNVNDIKVRIRTFQDSIVAGKSTDFIHVFGYIMEGRSTEQKAQLSRAMVAKLKSLYPDVSVISMNISDFEKATYCNLSMV